MNKIPNPYPPLPEPPAPIRKDWVDDCVFCSKFKKGDFFPPHDASQRCQSGKHPHCTCDTCF